MLSRAQAEADIDTYNQVLKEVHYNPFLYISADAYQRKTDSLKNTLTDSILIKSFLLKLSQLTGAINDGHTMPVVVQQAFKADFRKPIYFPLSLTAGPNGRLYTSEAYVASDIPAGAVILSVNGINLPQFFTRMTKGIGGLPAFKKTMVAGLLSNYLYYAEVKPPFKISYTVQGKPRSATIAEGVILKDILTKAFPQLGGTDYTFKVINSKLGYLNLVTMKDDYQRYGAFFDSCFTAMKAAHINALAIDLRHNSGGNAIIAHQLISYFNSKPYALSGGRYWKVSQRYKDLLVTRRDTGNAYLKQPNNTIIDQRQCGPRDPLFVNNKLLFSGKVYLITGSATFSSAMQLADAVKQYHMATILGEPTGEETTDFGELYKFELPNSKLQMQVTTTFDLGADCNPNKNHPVMPDHILSNTLPSSSDSNDAVISYILKQLK